MASFMRTLTKLASSPQGRQMVQRAKAEASKPQNRAKIEQIVRKVSGGKGGGTYGGGRRP